MNVSFVRTVDPVVEPVSVSEAKLQCRALSDVHDEDGLIWTYIRAARELGEGYTGRGWLTQTWKCVSDEWADEFPLPMAGPLQSVTSVKYYDADGTLQTLSASDYVVDTASVPGRVTRAPNVSWPSLQCDRSSWRVEITYVVGWSGAALVPEAYKMGTLLIVDHLYENRGAVQVGIGVGAVEIPYGVALLWGDRLYWSAPVCA